MAHHDEDDEIEFLDEDADLVQQCVQQISTNVTQEVTNATSHNVELDSSEEDLDKLIPSTTLIQSLLVEREPREPSPLLVERSKKAAPKLKRKLKKDDDDTDYNPSEEYSWRFKRKKQFNINKSNLNKPDIDVKPDNETSVKTVTFAKLPTHDHDSEQNSKKPQIDTDISLEQRRTLNISIPDYDDPLCLPVKCIKSNISDTTKLEDWNNLCLDQLKASDARDSDKTDEIVSSKNTVVLKSSKKKLTDVAETTLWLKKQVTNKNGEVSSELIQGTLPQYREKDLLQFTLSHPTKKRSFDKIINNREEVILTQVEDKDDVKLLVYKPKEALSAVYKFDDTKIKDKEQESKGKRSLKEVACCNVCSPCFQLSWRGVKSTEADKHISCPVCSRSYVSVYNLLSHVRTHPKIELRKYKRSISKAISKIVKYHYTCRICQEEFPGIKETRIHVRNMHRHTGEPILCEIGNHLVKPRTM